MARVAYVPYNDTMNSIFSALGVSITSYDFGGETGWYESDYQAALSAAWDKLFALDAFEFDGDPEDDWDEAEGLIHGPYQVNYWSTDSGHMPT